MLNSTPNHDGWLNDNPDDRESTDDEINDFVREKAKEMIEYMEAIQEEIDDFLLVKKNKAQEFMEKVTSNFDSDEELSYFFQIISDSMAESLEERGSK